SDSVDKNEVGGENLIQDSHFYGGTRNGWNSIYGTQKVENHILIKEYTTQAPASRIERVFSDLEIGQTYTLSVYIKTTVPLNWRTFVNAEDIVYSDNKLVDEWYIDYVTFTATDTDVTVRGYTENAPVGSTVFIDWFKLEKGNTPTDWTPAPEDFETYDDYIMWFVNSGKFQLEKDGVYGLADDIHIDYQKYVFEENNFSVYNAGNVEIEPESMYINIIVSGLNGEIEIKNLTTGQLFKLEKPFKGILELKGMSTKMNGTNIFRDTNKRLINLAVGKNDFEVTGNFKDITFDFKYYYK